MKTKDKVAVYVLAGSAAAVIAAFAAGPLGATLGDRSVPESQAAKPAHPKIDYLKIIRALEPRIEVREKSTGRPGVLVLNVKNACERTLNHLRIEASWFKGQVHLDDAFGRLVAKSLPPGCSADVTFYPPKQATRFEFDAYMQENMFVYAKEPVEIASEED